MAQTLLELGYIPTEVNYISSKEFVLIVDCPLTTRPLGRQHIKLFCGKGKSCGTKVLPLRGRVSKQN